MQRGHRITRDASAQGIHHLGGLALHQQALGGQTPEQVVILQHLN